MWEVVVLDYFEVGDSTAGLFCRGRFWYWTILLWEILMLDFLASGQMNRQANRQFPLLLAAMLCLRKISLLSLVLSTVKW